MGLDDLAAGLGPLPQSDENARLQRESQKALSKALLGQNNLVLRDEPKEDFGVDLSFEVNLAGQMTNFRSQIQLKSSASLTATAKGYFPLQVNSANLNHLLNGVSAIYILWDATRDEFWYVWAHDEHRRLAQENPTWQSQQTITLNFRKRFTAEAYEGIARYIVERGRLLRSIQDSLAKATEGETVVFRIDSDSLRITDANIATGLLLTGGAAIVASGYPQEVLDLMRLVDPNVVSLPRMQLTFGYAEYMLGNYFKAYGYIRQAMVRGQELSSRDYSFMTSLNLATELHVGLIDTQIFEERTVERLKALSGLEALEAEQDVLYRRYARAIDLDQRSELARQFRSLSERIFNEPGLQSTNRLGATLLLLYVEGVEANLRAAQTEYSAAIRSRLFPGDVQGVATRLVDAHDVRLRWETSADKALKDAYELNHPILIFQALVTALRIRMGRLFEDALDAIMSEVDYVVPSTVLSRFERLFGEAERLNAVNGSLEGRLQLEELRADLLELRGDRDAAKVLAEKTYPQALAMRYEMIADHSYRLMNDDTLLLRWRRSYQSMQEQDFDFEKASQTDEQMQRIAVQILNSVGSPPARREVIEAHLQSFREISRQRVEWCRHIQIFEDLVAAGNSQTAYSEPLMRKCSCEQFGYLSRVQANNALIVISDFKHAFCESCSVRDPKRK